jgi:hypothetical protein
MALMCPDTTEADVDGHTAAFRTMCSEIIPSTLREDENKVSN